MQNNLEMAVAKSEYLLQLAQGNSLPLLILPSNFAWLEKRRKSIFIREIFFGCSCSSDNRRVAMLRKRGMNKAARLIIIALPMHVLFCGCWEYFFEELPRELEIERWELLHPDQHLYYQTGPMHTLSITFRAILRTVVRATLSMPRGYSDDSFSTREALQQPHSRSEILRAKKADGLVVIELNIELHREQSKWK